MGALPPTWGGVTEAGVTPVVTQQQSAGLPNAPFSIEHAYTPESGSTLSTSVVTRDLWHRFYEHQMQIGHVQKFHGLGSVGKQGAATVAAPG